MQIVINIPEAFYEKLRKTDIMISGQRSGKNLMAVIYNAVINGTPLPKEHGRLIDADELEECYVVTMDDIRNAQTIIEADMESEADDE